MSDSKSAVPTMERAAGSQPKAGDSPGEMRVALSTIGKFHTFSLARQLHERGLLESIFTGYPRYKLGGEGLPASVIHSFPWLQTLYMANGRFGLKTARVDRELAWVSQRTFEAYVAAHLPACDVFLGLSGSALKAGIKAQRRGAIYICDRASSHIRYQDAILQEEYERHGMRWEGVDPRVIVQEEAEYAAADIITVGSHFAERSFLEMGVSASKLRRVPYGVDPSRFHPVAKPDADRFDVLFVGSVSLRKGIPYLLESFSRLAHPNKRLTIAGVVQPDVEPMIRRFSAQGPITCAGPCSQTELQKMMSRSHLLVLPSVEDGFGYVMAEAMACGCPVLATTNTGGMDLFEDGKEGFLVPIRDSAALAERMQDLADHPDTQRRMAGAALERVKALGGWDSYGRAMTDLFAEVVETRGLSVKER